jgi:serine protease Do
MLLRTGETTSVAFRSAKAAYFRGAKGDNLLRCLAVCGLLLVVPRSVSAADPSAADSVNVALPKGIADIRALESTIRKTVAKVTPSVVSVAGASGVVINSEGYVLTVAHVGQRAGRDVAVIFPDGRRVQAVTLGNDQGVDAGMVKITDTGPWPSVEMGSSAGLKPGQWCLTLGYPMTFEAGKPPLVRIGRVLLHRKTEIIADGTIMGGDSGAPLFDLDGKVIGIGTKCDNSLAWNIHVPIDCFRDEWDLLAKGQDFDSLAPKTARLGIIFVAETEGVQVDSIEAGSGADKAGLKSGDALLKLSGAELHRYSDVPPLLRRHRPGDKVEIEFRRGKDVLKLQITLGEKAIGQDP